MFTNWIVASEYCNSSTYLEVSNDVRWKWLNFVLNVVILAGDMVVHGIFSLYLSLYIRLGIWCLNNTDCLCVMISPRKMSVTLLQKGTKKMMKKLKLLPGSWLWCNIVTKVDNLHDRMCIETAYCCIGHIITPGASHLKETKWFIRSHLWQWMSIEKHVQNKHCFT